MKMSLMQLRRNPGKLLKAVEGGAEVLVSKRGKTVARVVAINEEKASARIVDHPAFGIWADRRDLDDPAAHVRALRRGRFGAL
jgi:prevent-host-death family protein